MNKRHALGRFWDRSRRGPVVLCSLVLPLIAGFSLRVEADDYLNLPAVRPVMSCPDLQSADPGTMEGATVVIQSAAVTATPKGPFCRVTGVVGQVTAFEVLLPLEHWTQRLLQIAASSGVPYAGGCAPAVNGEFAVVFTGPGTPARADTSREADLQSQIDSAYRATHLATLAAKALIRALYGQPQRFAYFIGCSAGGGQAMIAVQRHPEDFDGVSAGSPLLISGVHNVFYHPWESTINKRADGSRILASNRLPILHRAVMEHCAKSAGALDGVLLQPTACRFQRAWVQCKAGASDTSACLTAEEVGVVENLYAGPGGQGRRFEIGGFAMGSELSWGLSTADRIANPEANTGARIKRLLQQPESDLPAEELQKRFAYTHEWFDKISALAPLYGSANTNIRPFQQRGGKLILWNGGADLTIQPEVSVAYYQGVQKILGVRETDRFMRLFMIPGFGHCAGGEIPFQFDVLTPLMAWTELDRAPARLLAGKPANGRGNVVPFGGVRNPVAAADVPNAFMRPIFAFPNIAHYAGRGDPDDAASYRSVRSAAPVPQKFNTEAAALFAPDNQRTWHVENGRLVPDKK